MKIHLLTVSILCLLTTSSYGQMGNEDLKTLLIVRDLERESRSSRSALTGPKVVGDPYYSDKWNNTVFVLYAEGKTYRLPMVKYDMLNFGLDILADSKLKFLDGNLVKSFEYKDSVTNVPHRFLNGKDFMRDWVPIHGFLEILCWGKIDVFSFTETSVTNPNYNVILNTGSEDYQIVKRRILLYGSGANLRSMNKKELEALWSQKESEMKKFQRINKLNLSKERDLLLMVDYFNTL